MLVDDLADLPHQPPALGGGHPAPGRVLERLAGCGHGKVDVVAVAVRNVIDDLAERRIEDLERAAVAGLDPVAANQHPLGLL